MTNERRPAIRRELHFGERVVRCFAQRPAHVDAMSGDTAGRHPDREAVALGDTRVTYRTLDAIVDTVAGNLAAHGFHQGDRLALLVSIRLEFVFALLAAARIGVIAVAMNIRQRKPEIEFVLNQCAAAGLIYETDLAEQIPERSAVPSLRQVFVVGGAGDTSFDQLRRPAHAPPCTIGEEDVFCLLYT